LELLPLATCAQRHRKEAPSFNLPRGGPLWTSGAKLAVNRRSGKRNRENRLVLILKRGAAPAVA
jgi:hypothetical protein